MSVRTPKQNKLTNKSKQMQSIHTQVLDDLPWLPFLLPGSNPTTEASYDRKASFVSESWGHSITLEKSSRSYCMQKLGTDKEQYIYSSAPFFNLYCPASQKRMMTPTEDQSFQPS